MSVGEVGVGGVGAVAGSIVMSQAGAVSLKPMTYHATARRTSGRRRRSSGGESGGSRLSRPDVELAGSSRLARSI